MMQTFTQDDLIRYLYHETSEEENRLLEQQLDTDTRLRAHYLELRQTIRLLTDSELTLPDPCTSRILQSLGIQANPTA